MNETTSRSGSRLKAAMTTLTMTAFLFLIWQPAHGQWATNGNNINNTNPGNVGIGTTAPVAGLDTRAGAEGAATSGALGTVALVGSNGTASALNFGVSGTGTVHSWLQARDRNSPATFYALVLNPLGGNIGIGTTTPAAFLHVSGANTTANPSAIFDGIGLNPQMRLRRSNGTAGSPTQVLSGQHIGNFQFTGYGSSGFPSVSLAALRVFAAENFTDSAAGTRMDFSTTPIGSITQTVRVTIDSTGNVGIGTTAPASRFHLYADSYLTQQRATDTAPFGVNFTNSAGGALGFLGVSRSDGTGFVTGGTANSLVLRAESADTFIASGATAIATFRSSGNVGIGTTTPAYRLDVSGGTGIVGQFSGRVGGGNAVANNEFVTLSQLTAATAGSANSFIQGGSSFGAAATLGTNDNNALAFETSGAERARINTSGNIGIGTTTPTSLAHLFSPSQSGTRLTVENTGSTDYQGADILLRTPQGRGAGVTSFLGTTNVNWFFGNPYGNTDAFSINRLSGSQNNAVISDSNSLLYVNSSGNVGIGTTNPEVKLDVAGGIRSTGLIQGSGNSARVDTNVSNYVGNGSFEINTTGWSFFGNTARVSDGAVGSYSLSNSDGHAFADYSLASLPTNGSRTFTVSVWARTSSAAGFLFYIYTGTGPDTGWFMCGVPIIAAATTWTRYSGTCTITGTVSVLRFYRTGSGTIYIDGVQMEEGTLASNYRPGIFANPDGTVRLQGGQNFSTDGNVGIGTTTPSTRLHVEGDVTVTGNISARYQDVAEWVPSRQRLSAGTVVALDTTASNHVEASTQAYDTRVAGVISARPGLILGEAGEGRVMVATTGRVRVRVDATRAPVRVGDLLVTSAREGYAMRSEPVSFGGVQMHRPGTLLGRALEPLASGTGEILVLLSLQ